MTKFALKDIKANPFRHIERYPIRREKVEALKESLETTGYWGNVVARLANGGAEIAYGHHRLVAMREYYQDPNHLIDLLVHDLDDDAMLKIMARENMEEWGTSAAVEQETVRAVVEGYAAGRIHLQPPPPHSQVRYAPSFVLGRDPSLTTMKDTLIRYPYTAQTVAHFLGWLKRPGGQPQDKIGDTLSALQFIEQGSLSEAVFDGLNTSQAKAVVMEARRVREHHEASARIAQKDADKRAAEALKAKEQEERAEEQRQQHAERARRAQEREAFAEHQQRQREQEAQAASNEQARLRAAREALENRRQAALAVDVREKATKAAAEAEAARRAAATKRAAAEIARQSYQQTAATHRQQGHAAVTKVGRGISEQLKSGTIGFKGARNAAIGLGSVRKDMPPPRFEDFLRRLLKDTSAALDDRDPRLRDWKEVIKYKAHLPNVLRKDAAVTLRNIAQRFLDLADDIDGEQRPAQPGVSKFRQLTNQGEPA
jgi:chemotaxis protein histidine kinase CheA